MRTLRYNAGIESETCTIELRLVSSTEMYNISQDEKTKYYLVYKAIFNLSDLNQKNKLLTALGAGFEFPWRVVGITPGALTVLASNNYKYIKGQLCRAHISSRIDTARKVFERPAPLSEDEFFDVLWANDETVISTKSENKVGGVLPKWIEVDYRDGLFRGAKQVGWRHTRKEVDFLRQLHTKESKECRATVSE